MTQPLAAGASDPGRRRTNNEDCFHVDPVRGIYFVVDGMGGHQAGEVAAKIAVDLLRQRLERQTGSTAERIREAITVANNEIFEQGQLHPERMGMACVLTVAVVEQGQATVGHVGDSRLYHLRDGQIKKVTHDHSPVGEREDRGELTEQEAMRHPRRNEVYRDVGSKLHRPEDADFVEIATVAFGDEDALLICSDGLSDLVPAADIRAIAEQQAAQPKRAVQSLIDAANEAGGKDNVTVVFVAGPDFARTGAKVPAVAQTRVTNPFWVGPRLAVLLTLLPLLTLVIGIYLAPYWPWRTPVAPADTAADDAGVYRVGPGAAYATIAAALEKAGPGETVEVLAGEYREAVQLPEGVTLKSQSTGGAKLFAPEGGTAVTANGIKSGRLVGFLIQGDAAHPLQIGVLLRNSSVEVTDVSVDGASTAGIMIDGSGSSVLLADRIIAGAGPGLLMTGTVTPRVGHCLISSNGLKGKLARPGVELREQANPNLTNNVLISNTAEAVWAPKLSSASEWITLNYFMPPTPARRLRVLP